MDQAFLFIVYGKTVLTKKQMIKILVEQILTNLLPGSPVYLQFVLGIGGIVAEQHPYIILDRKSVV